MTIRDFLEVCEGRVNIMEPGEFTSPNIIMTIYEFHDLKPEFTEEFLNQEIAMISPNGAHTIDIYPYGENVQCGLKGSLWELEKLR